MLFSVFFQNSAQAQSRTVLRKRGPSVGRWPVVLLLLIITTSSCASAQSELGWIVFGSVRDGEAGLFIMDADGANQTRLTTGEGDRFPVWSPDGCRIFYRRFLDIYVMDPDGSNQTLVRQGPRLSNPEWLFGVFLLFSPDGSKILFEGGVINADGSNLVRVSWDRGGGVSWLPGGSAILFQRSEEIYVMNADGTSQRKLANGKLSSRSPDGSAVLFRLSEHDGEIYVMNTDGTSQRKLAEAESASWSPDGSKIALGLTGGTEIVVMEWGGTNVTPLTQGSNPSWSPDGSRILFSPGGEGQLAAVNADGTNRIKLADQLLSPFVAFFSPQMSWSPDGSKILFTRRNAPRPESFPVPMEEWVGSWDIYIVNTDGSDFTRLTTGGMSISPRWSPSARCEE